MLVNLTKCFQKKVSSYSHNLTKCFENEVSSLGTVMISAFSEEEVKKNLEIREKIYCIMPVGKK